ncbi:MAG: hypothetical protein LCI02_08875 [Proteobacteria bacterium]|nr:hypothetical protein [Pseudomonadota bacterium]
MRRSVLAAAALAAALAVAAPLARADEAAKTAATATATAAAAAIDAQAPTASLRAEARAAADRRDWAAALPRYALLVQRHGDDADLLIEAARVNGYADRNAEAAALYRQALAAAPARRADIVPSLAWQALWSGAAAEAQTLFAERLAAAAGNEARVEALDGLGQARQLAGDQAGALAAFAQAHGLAPQQRRLHRRYAMSLLWNGQEAAAITELQALVAAEPQDRDLAWALANAYNFNGQHRLALRRFNALSAPVHPGERADLARAWRWAGYEERAWPLLADPTDRDSAWLRDWRVWRERTRYAYLTVERADDRDRLRADAQVLGAGWHPWAGATADLQWRRLQLQDPAGEPEGGQLQASLGWRAGEPDGRFGTWWTTAALKASRLGGWSTLLPSLRLRGVPDDGWRVDAEATRELVETPRALAARVTVDVLSAGVEQRPDARWLWAAEAAALRFDDGTLRLRAGGRVEHRLLNRPRLALGLEASGFERVHGSDAIDRGYWNPRRYAQARLYLALQHEMRPFELRARAGLGRSREVDAAGNASSGQPHLWELGIDWDVTPGWRLGLAAGGSGQSLGLAGAGGGTGYWRRYVNLSANLWF